MVFIEWLSQFHQQFPSMSEETSVTVGEAEAKDSKFTVSFDLMLESVFHVFRFVKVFTLSNLTAAVLQVWPD